MKKIIILLVFILLFVGILYEKEPRFARFLSRPDTTGLLRNDNEIKKPVLSIAPNEITSNEITKSIFVPYWSLADSLPEYYETLIYFGITANEEGIDRNEVGYKNLDNFVDNVPDSQKTSLTLRLLNNDINLKILENEALQKKVIQETIDVAKTKNFDTVVLDLEPGILPIVDLSKNINKFVQSFYQETKKADLKFTVLIYGDVFYRVRPFDVKFIGENSDEVLIMAYDFSKSYGEPGPNFPLQGEDIFGYSLEKMIADFTEKVPAKKLGVIVGMYGYDWTLGPQGKPLKRAEVVTLNQAQARFIQKQHCDFTNCSIVRDARSAETKVTYKDDEGKNHEVWFEDVPSTKSKIEVLKKNGIFNVSYWAYSYF